MSASKEQEYNEEVLGIGTLDPEQLNDLGGGGKPIPDKPF